MAGLVAIGASMMFSAREPTTSFAATSPEFDRDASVRWFGMVEGGETEE
jgi:hypothetical protein